MAELTTDQVIQLAMQHHSAGRLREAEEIYRKVLAVEPQNHNALQLYGHLAFMVNQFEAAVDLLRRAIAVEPNTPHYHNNLGSALMRLKRDDEAVAAWERACQLDPNFFIAHANAADIYSNHAQYDHAIRHYEACISIDPKRADGWNNLGQVFYSIGRNADAEAKFVEAIRVQPDQAESHLNLANVYLETGRGDAAVDGYREAIRIKSTLGPAYHNLLYALHFDSRMDRQSIFREHTAWAAARANPLIAQAVPHANERDPDRVIRVGYISQDLRNHPVGRFMLPILREHDRARVEVHVFSDVLIEDDVTARLKAYTPHWHRIQGMNDDAVVKLIREKGIDILVELTGHAGVNRLSVMARKPAPVGVSYLGYPDTTGMSAIDYRLTDALADPPGESDPFYTEKLWRLPNGLHCFQFEDLPDVSPPPALKNGFVTFGSFNNFAKASAKTIKLWADVLAKVPGSKLLIKANALGDLGTQEGVRKRLIEQGIPADRLEIRGRTKAYRDHVMVYADIDVALDTTPYNGTTTTLEALSMGVPVVSVVGEAHMARMGLSLLTHAGFAEWVAQSAEEYVEIATDLASDIDRVAKLRAELRSRLLASPLGDAPRFARDLESAYRQMWRAWCANSLT